MLILKRKCLVGASRVRCRESGTPSTIIYTRWSSRRYKLGCDAPVLETTVLFGMRQDVLVKVALDWHIVVFGESGFMMPSSSAHDGIYMTGELPLCSAGRIIAVQVFRLSGSPGPPGQRLLSGSPRTGGESRETPGVSPRWVTRTTFINSLTQRLQLTPDNIKAVVWCCVRRVGLLPNINPWTIPYIVRLFYYLFDLLK